MPPAWSMGGASTGGRTMQPGRTGGLQQGLLSCCSSSGAGTSPCSHLHLLCVSTVLPVLPAFLSSRPGNLDHTEHEGCSSVFLLWWGLRKAVLAVEPRPVWSCCTSGGQSVICQLVSFALPFHPSTLTKPASKL